MEIKNLVQSFHRLRFEDVKIEYVPQGLFEGVVGVGAHVADEVD